MVVRRLALAFAEVGGQALDAPDLTAGGHLKHLPEVTPYTPRAVAPQVAFPAFSTQYFARAGYLEPLGGTLMSLDLGHSSVTSTGRNKGLGWLAGWGKEHQHRVALHHRRLFDGGHIAHLLGDLLKKLPGNLLMGYLPATEAYSHSDLSPIGQKLPRLIHLDDDIVISDLGPDANLLDLDLLLGLACLTFPFSALVHELAIVQQPTNWRIGSRRHLDEIQTAVVSQTLRLSSGIDAQLLASLINQPDFLGADLII